MKGAGAEFPESFQSLAPVTHSRWLAYLGRKSIPQYHCCSNSLLHPGAVFIVTLLGSFSSMSEVQAQVLKVLLNSFH